MNFNGYIKWNCAGRFACLASFLLLTACSGPASKTGALDRALLKQRPLPADQLRTEQQQVVIKPGPDWFADIDPAAHLTFAGYRAVKDELLFCLVLTANPANDQLVLWPLDEDETPLTVLNDPERRSDLEKTVAAWQSGHPVSGKLIETSLVRTIEAKRLGPPLPEPRHIYAVAANYPSHLTYDLAVKDMAQKREVLAEARPRVFVKYPPVAPPDQPGLVAEFSKGLLGPFDDLEIPENIELPKKPDNPNQNRSPVHFDYEAEIGVVIGRRLTWTEVAGLSDEELLQAVAGYLLVSDAKTRDPQVVNKVIRVDSRPEVDNSYLIGEDSLDAALGIWDSVTCQWWSYAAGWGRFTSVGPMLVASSNRNTFPDRGLVGGRSFGALVKRGLPIPEGSQPAALYLRQAVTTTLKSEHPDALIWSVPTIIRSILDPEANALAFMADGSYLEPGDIISMGTPGGVILTAKPAWMLPVADNLLFWKKPMDMHRMFFAENEAHYLLPGDELFLWAEGLGYQKTRITRTVSDER